jgi:DNA (cytosine-5)-methyltransferase 1
MKYISLFAGIGGFDLALQRQGHECVYVNEWDKYAVQIYEKNFSHKPDTRDIRTIDASEIPAHDLLVGGFPCQSFSVAGKRGGFEDTRGTLFFEIARIAKAKRTSYLFLENVKGLLNHAQGNTFATIITALDELGYDCQWQVLNSKDFGVPQNRERVFIIGHLRGSPRPKIFPIGESDQGGFSAHQKKQGDGKQFRRKYIANTLRQRDHKGGGNLVQRIPLKFLGRNQKNIEGDYAFTVDRMNTGGVMVGTYRTHKDGQGFRENKHGISPTIPARAREDGSGQPTILSHHPRSGDPSKGGTGPMMSDKHSFTLDSTPHLAIEDMRIRRLTPKECERLQGFPDDWTLGISDTQRYKCLGNAVTVNIIEEIMKRFIV